MPSALPVRSNSEYYRKQAKALLREHRTGAGAARMRAQLALGRAGDQVLALTDAQYVIAREHGHESWGAFMRAVRAPSAVATALAAASRSWGERGEATLTTAHAYGPGRPVCVHVAKRGRRYDIDDRGAALRAAGHPPGWRETAERVVALAGLNVNRTGSVFVPAHEGRDLVALVERVAQASAAVYGAVLDENGAG